jgi:hypothetical protein
MSRIILLFVISIILAPVINAQNYEDIKMPAPEEQARKTVEDLIKKIPMTVAKKDSAVEIFSEFFNNMETYRTDGNKDLIQYIEKVRDDKIKNLLKNDLQYVTYTKFLLDLKARREKMGKSGGPKGQDVPGQQGGPGGNRSPNGNFGSERNEGF